MMQRAQHQLQRAPRLALPGPSPEQQQVAGGELVEHVIALSCAGLRHQ
jgi:hypothetical protein